MITIVLSVIFFFVYEMFKTEGFQHHPLGLLLVSVFANSKTC